MPMPMFIVGVFGRGFFLFFVFRFFLRFRLLLLLLAALEYANMATAPLLSSPASSVNFCRRRGRFSFFC